MIYNNNEKDNSVLFFKIWRQRYLKRQIEKHLELYKKYDTVEVNSLKELIFINSNSNPYRLYISKIRYNCNEPITTIGLIPENVTTIIFGDEFNQSIAPAGSIPNTITTIVFGRSFNQPLKPIDSCLAQSVIEFAIDKYFTQIINLDGGIIENEHRHDRKQNKKLKFGRSFKPAGSIPKVHTLSFGKDFNQPLEPGAIPLTVRSLSFSDEFNQPILPGALPSSLESLSFGRYFNQPLEHNSIPQGLKVIRFGKYFNQVIKEGIISPNTIIIR
ncbi:hypothetical protein DICPUDRAFT_148547 [Dictyostelium purpureum]|uniref:FNIP repeat-containing protein n=1 Tax=Dictyostelium purpureum TaxID=5786 RepID=F0ZBE8_DICPU|nr:uncharacterized protein DICPUDRAFT_148547 [Dictyostelium purpureum]EGC38760.1 hypothetical protein DICPUDRAFT_148547 [Dictyostelium purpureum]|eukprot:XP_003284751.1 hypothetical protein DICPUDRAFT_148547 [Dictyostelium purpureum]